MTIKLNGDHRTVRETTADWQYTNDKGEAVTEPIAVRYFSPTIEDVRRQKAAITKAYEDGSDWYMSHQLVSALESLPDLIDPKTNKPVKVTIEFLDKQEILNLRSLVKAIDDDLDPKSRPAT